MEDFVCEDFALLVDLLFLFGCSIGSGVSRVSRLRYKPIKMAVVCCSSAHRQWPVMKSIINDPQPANKAMTTFDLPFLRPNPLLSDRHCFFVFFFVVFCFCCAEDSFVEKKKTFPMKVHQLRGEILDRSNRSPRDPGSHPRRSWLNKSSNHV